MSKDISTKGCWLTSLLIILITFAGYYYRFILYNEGSILFVGVIIFELSLALFCFVSGLLFIPQTTWIKIREKLNLGPK